MNIRLNNLALLRCYLSDNAHLITREEYNLLDGWARSGNIPGLASADSLVNPATHGVHAYRLFRQVAAFVKKSKTFTDPEKAFAACKASFLEAEARCKATNLRLDTFYTERLGVIESFDDVAFRLKIQRMQDFISKVLGPYDPFYEAIPQLVKVTSGATATRKRALSKPFMKMRGRIECTLGAVSFVDRVAQGLGYKPRYRILNFNRVGTVPKSWKTDRTIACEPVGNVPIQLAFDCYAKTRLKRIGIDLSDQTRNQELAKAGSVDDSLSTIDLSAASDSVSLNAIHLLFPREWATFLLAIRSSHFVGPFGSGKYHKFSSMGNGTTFAVETLIFAAACASLKPREMSVYGDDIIIDSDKTQGLIEILSYLGFVVNEDKSFTSGPFRESCGKDYYLGIDVTPFYVKESDSLPDLCHVVNGLASICTPGGKLATELVKLVREYKLPLVPANSDSRSGVHVDVYTAYQIGLLRRAPNRRQHWYQTLEFKGFVTSVKTYRIADIRTYALWFIGRRTGDPDFPSGLPSQEVTEVATERVKTRIRWIPWFPRIVPTVQLSGWSDYLYAELSLPPR